MEEKQFYEWIGLKEKIHFSNSRPKINEGDIWWCGCGENVGVEINGKSSRLGKYEYAAVCQARVMSTSRLYSKIGRVPDSDLGVVKEAFLNLYK